MSSKLNSNYNSILTGLKDKIRQARFQASLTVNAQLLALYWEIGKTILQQQHYEGWGSNVIGRLAKDLKAEFPDMKGLSDRNLVYMQTFAGAYPEITQQPVAKLKKGRSKKEANPITQQSVAEIGFAKFLQHPIAKLPWGHNCVLLDKLKTTEERLFYAFKTAENGWSREILILQIKNNLYKRQGKTISNFDATLPKLQSDLVKETLKNPYVFDFLSLGEEMQERDLEKALIQHIKKFMLELGRGFAYVGNQYNLNIKGDDYFLDLLFYNYHLHCFVVFELKVGEFKPEFAGKLNFYINTVDEQVKGKDHKPTIGVLLCKTPNDTVVKFALKGIKTPMGVADYELAKALPKQLKGEMPSIEELEAEIDKEYKVLQKPLDKKMDRLKELLSDLKEEEVKEKRNTENTVKICNKVVLPLKKGISQTLEKEIGKWFEETKIMIWTESRGHHSDKEAKDYLKNDMKNRCNEFKIEVRTVGFKPAGTRAFNCWKDLSISLGDYKYSIGLNRHGQDAILEKLYHQLPSQIELNGIVEKFSEIFIDDIMAQVERIKQPKK